MALNETASVAAAKFSALPIARQVGVLVGLAASIAIGIGVVFWSQEGSFRPLFSHLNSRDASNVIDVLERSGIEYRINKQTGTIMVDSDDVHDARMKLAQEGLPRGNGHGFEMFNNAGGIATSQFMENARYRHALETELARTISNLNNVKSARVHLAIPRQSSFVRDNRKASASVFVDVYAGHHLRHTTIASIVHLVASSIPGLNSENVTVVDQNGQLLSEGGGNSVMRMTDRFFEYRQQLEHTYAQKIEDILVPILGPGKVRAKVSADLDFTSAEQTRERYNPDMGALRSEQLVEEKRAAGTQATGVPGSLANQPPSNANSANTEQATTQPLSESKDLRIQSTKNYELDKTISHTKQNPGRINRLSVAVLIDNRSFVDPKTGKMVDKPLSKDEIEKIKKLVADAVGLNVQRGDSLNVVNSGFAKPEPVDSFPEESFYKQEWFIDMMKQVAGGIVVLLLIFGVLRPTIKGLAGIGQPINTDPSLPAGDSPELIDASVSKGVPTELQTFEDRMGAVQNMANSDPKRVAQVVKTWVDGA